MNRQSLGGNNASKFEEKQTMSTIRENRAGQTVRNTRRRQLFTLVCLDAGDANAFLRIFITLFG